MLALAYVVGWGAYAYTHQSGPERYRVLAAGEAAEVSTATVRLAGLTIAGEVADQRNGGEPAVPPAGAVWVVGQLEVTTRPAEAGQYCSFALIGPDRRVWDPQTVYGRTLPSSCSDDAVTVGAPTRIEVVFAVPRRYADRLVGVAVVDRSTAARTQVLRPA